MKILLITNMYPTKKDPAYGVFIKNICSGLTNQGCSVKLITIYGRPGNYLLKLVKYVILYLKILFINFKDYDFVYLSYPSHTYIPCLFRRIETNKVIVRLHGTDLIPVSKSTLSKFMQKVVFKCVQRARLIVVPSTYFKNILIDLLNKSNIHLESSKIFINPSGGVNHEILYPVRSDAHDFQIGYIGRFDKTKGTRVLLRAIKHLEFPYKLIMVGDGPEKKYIINYIKSNNLSEKIILYKEQPQEILGQFYNLFSVFVFPTLRKQESLGNVAIEALSCGVPVIGSNIAAVKDYIKEDYNGYLFEPDNSAKLSERLNMFYNLPREKKNQLKDNARRSVVKYSSQKVSLDFYNKLQEISIANDRM
ncbi:MAG: glycosyltransferase family 4 protein [Bacteroidales bacterium]|nr:MAG: glycosyltransferase family 4 protein [Bacteroidales bacterium]